MNNIKLGIIGTNFISDWMCDAVASVDGITAAAVISREQSTADKFAAKHNIELATTDVETFHNAVDAVYIASPNFLHHTYAMRSIKAGKHVIVEKPAALSAEQFTEMTEAAKARGVVIMEAMRPTNDPVLDTVRETMRTIGAIRHARFDFCQYSSRYDKFRAGIIENAFNPSLGNASLMDIGVYALAVAVGLFGAPESVVSSSTLLDNGFEGCGSVMLGYADGLSVEVVYSKIHESQNVSEICGEDGAIYIGRLSMLEWVKIRRRTKNTGNGKNEFADEWLVQNRGGDTSNMVYEVENFVRAIRGERDADTKATLEVLRVMDEIRRQNGIEFGAR